VGSENPADEKRSEASVRSFASVLKTPMELVTIPTFGAGAGWGLSLSIRFPKILREYATGVRDDFAAEYPMFRCGMQLLFQPAGSGFVV
jgi:hypothetical protein